jgi:hypothetical protein
MTSSDDDDAFERQDVMPRTIIDLPDTQLRDLDARCDMLRVSRAEAVRRAVDAFLRETITVSGFGLWNGSSSGVARYARSSGEQN